MDKIIEAIKRIDLLYCAREYVKEQDTSVAAILFEYLLKP